jgi:ABC-type nitrate/sulfonate/bicarbonate transport system substrate-binding protein
MHPRACLPLLLSCAFLGCGTERARATTGPGELESPSLRYQGYANVVSYPELAEDLGYLAPLKLEWIGNTISGPQDIQSVVTGDVDFGGAFNGAIIKLIAAKAPIRAVIGYYGIDDRTWSGFFVREDSPIESPRDLIGKQIAMNTLGAHSEFMLREYLSRAGLKPADAKQVSLLVVPPLNGEQTLRQGQVDVAVLGGIFRDRALERGGLRRLFSDYDLVGPLTAGSYVFSTRTLRERPNTVRQFTRAMGRAIEWARAQKPDVVQARLAAILRKRGRGEDPSLAQFWKSTGIAQAYGRIADHEFQIWIDWLIKDGVLKPGQLAPADLFTNEFIAE